MALVNILIIPRLIQLSAWKSSLSEHFFRWLSDAREKSRRAFGWAEPLRAEMH